MAIAAAEAVMQRLAAAESAIGTLRSIAQANSAVLETFRPDIERVMGSHEHLYRALQDLQ